MLPSLCNLFFTSAIETFKMKISDNSAEGMVNKHYKKKTYNSLKENLTQKLKNSDPVYLKISLT